MTVISLDAFRATVRRRARLARLVIFLTGFAVTIVFVALRLFGVVDWAVIWLLLPALIDVGLWFSALRAEAVIRTIRDDDEDDQDEGA